MATKVENVPVGAGRPAAFFERVAPATHALLRMGAALLFMQHGVQKLFGVLGGMGGSGASAPLVSLMGLAGVLETFGGFLLFIGLLTRPMAFLLVGQMAVAYVMAHLPRGLFPIQNEGELALLFALVFAFLFGNGAGPLSVDHTLAERRARRSADEDRLAAQRRGRAGEPARKRGAA